MRGVRRTLKALAAIVVAFGLAFAAVIVFYSAVLPPLDMSAAEERSAVVLDRGGHLLRPFTTPDGRWRLPVEVADVDPRYLKLLFGYEDQRFASHMGIDPAAMLRAGFQIAWRGHIVSGGSTLTMQVARLIEPRGQRSLLAKTRQMIRAVQLERRYSKDELLALYLALAPFGGNLEGIRAASYAYFGKEPNRLSLGEAALLVALPQSPEFRRPDRHDDAARRARDRVLDRAAALKLFSEAEIENARAERIPEERRYFPARAPQLADAARKERPTAQLHRLTLDLGLQSSLETLAAERAATIGPKVSVAMLVVDNSDGAILASVGGADYLSKERAGALDLTHALRSPGSTLKPFIYGLAFEEGIAHPETLLQDRPSQYGLYAPENFDLTFQGMVSARRALQMSLNVPAVDLLALIGPQRLLTRLRFAGARMVLPDEAAPGLSIGLGGLGTTLSDLATLYVGLARGGETVPLSYRFDAAAALTKTPETRRFLDPVAAWYVADVLKGAPPPPNAQAGRYAFKTGTSYGYRDAWAIGFDRRHTIAVWVGRPDGAPIPGILGRLTAAPILNEAFSRIGISNEAFERPANALVATNQGLPPPLRHTRADIAKTVLPGESAIRIAFPPDGSSLDLRSSGEGVHDVQLKAQGGLGPITWMIDGKPLREASSRREASFVPDSLGFVRILVMDAKGATDSVTVRLQ